MDIELKVEERGGAKPELPLCPLVYKSQRLPQRFRFFGLSKWSSGFYGQDLPQARPRLDAFRRVLGFFPVSGRPLASSASTAPHILPFRYSTFQSCPHITREV
jgi:hypothetical protein